MDTNHPPGPPPTRYESDTMLARLLQAAPARPMQEPGQAARQDLLEKNQAMAKALQHIAARCIESDAVAAMMANQALEAAGYGPVLRGC